MRCVGCDQTMVRDGDVHRCTSCGCQVQDEQQLMINRLMKIPGVRTACVGVSLWDWGADYTISIFAPTISQEYSSISLDDAYCQLGFCTCDKCCGLDRV